VRFSIEVQAAEAAASRATPEQIEQLHAALGATEVVLEDFEQLATMDVAFHEAIFAASGNLVLGFFGSACQSLLVESRRLTYAGSLYRGETSEVALNDHRRILAAIEQHDPGAAREAMLAHLNMTRDVLMEAHRQTRSLSTPLRSEDVLTLAIEKHRGQPRESPQRADESGYSQTSPEGISQ
jgi:GntR family transcriptional repressor for pyruvate dehydrogenase complex